MALTGRPVLGPAFRSLAPLAAALAIALAAFGIGAAVDLPRTLMSRADYLAETHRLARDARRTLAECREAPVSRRGLCRARARAEERIERASLEVRYHGTVETVLQLERARARARFDTTRARCASSAAGERRECLAAAREGRRELAGAGPGAI